MFMIITSLETTLIQVTLGVTIMVIIKTMVNIIIIMTTMKDVQDVVEIEKQEKIF